MSNRREKWQLTVVRHAGSGHPGSVAAGRDLSGKQVYLQDGGIVECKRFRQRGNLVIVNINRDTVVEFDRKEVDRCRTLLQSGKEHRHGKNAKPVAADGTTRCGEDDRQSVRQSRARAGKTSGRGDAQRPSLGGKGCTDCCQACAGQGGGRCCRKPVPAPAPAPMAKPAPTPPPAPVAMAKSLPGPRQRRQHRRGLLPRLTRQKWNGASAVNGNDDEARQRILRC